MRQLSCTGSCKRPVAAHTASRQQPYCCPLRRQRRQQPLVLTQAAAAQPSPEHQPSNDDAAFRLPSPQQLERAWAEQTADGSLADEFFNAFKAPEQQQGKVFVFVRHGHSTWNEQSRIQGNTDESELTAVGRAQALRARDALSHIQFDSCFSSPHTRARQSTEIIWPLWQHSSSSSSSDAAAAVQGPPPPYYLPSLSEVDLGWFQGLRNADIARDHPELYRVWREEPERFSLDGRFPVLDAFRQARRAWSDMLSYPGSQHLVVTHKSLLRAMLCTALGLPPRQFRAIDLSNAAVCMVRCNARGDLMLSALNLTSHLIYDEVRYTLPGANTNDKLAGAAGLATAAAVNNCSNGAAAAESYSQS